MAVHDEGAFWSIFGYLLSGLVIWGGIGHFVDRWMGTQLFSPADCYWVSPPPFI